MCIRDRENLVSVFGTDYTVTIVVTALIVAFITALVVIGGLQRIASVTSIIVPFMAIAYVIVCLCILVYNIERVPESIVMVVRSAFGLDAVAGGALGALMMAMQMGVARGCLLYTSIQNCIEAIDKGVSRVHIMDGRIPHSLLLEIFTNKGIGTAIIKDNEEKYWNCLLYTSLSHHSCNRSGNSTEHRELSPYCISYLHYKAPTVKSDRC